LYKQIKKAAHEDELQTFFSVGRLCGPMFSYCWLFSFATNVALAGGLWVSALREIRICLRVKPSHLRDLQCYFETYSVP